MTSTTTGLNSGITLWKRARSAHRAEQDVDRRSVVGNAGADIGVLDGKLTELGIVLERGPWVETDGTVSGLITDLSGASFDVDDVPETKQLYVKVRDGQIKLYARNWNHAYGEAGQLRTLADIGCALANGAVIKTGRTNGEQAQDIAHEAPGDCGNDVYQICRALEGLTYAVLEVADQLDQLTDADGALADIAGNTESLLDCARDTGGEW